MSKRQRLFSFRLGSCVKKLILAENLRFRWNFEKESQVFEGSLVCTVTMQSADCVPCSLQTAYLAPCSLQTANLAPCSLQTAQVLRLHATYILPVVHIGEYFWNVYFNFFSCIVFSLFVMKIRLAPPIHIYVKDSVTSIITHLLVIIICFDVLCNV